MRKSPQATGGSQTAHAVGRSGLPGRLVQCQRPVCAALPAMRPPAMHQRKRRAEAGTPMAARTAFGSEELPGSVELSDELTAGQAVCSVELTGGEIQRRGSASSARNPAGARRDSLGPTRVERSEEGAAGRSPGTRPVPGGTAWAPRNDDDSTQPCVSTGPSRRFRPCRRLCPWNQKRCGAPRRTGRTICRRWKRPAWKVGA